MPHSRIMLFKIKRAIDFIIGEEDVCDHVTGNDFCPSCGKQLRAEPFDLETLVMDFSAFWVRRAFRQTVVGLFIHPGRSLRGYLRKDRLSLIRPVLYLSFTALFAFWAMRTVSALQICGVPDANPCTLIETFPFFIQFLQAIVFAIIFRFVFFRDTVWNIWEFSAVMSYLLAQGFIITGVISLGAWAIGVMPPMWIAMVTRNIYHFYVLMRFLEARTLKRKLRVLGAFVLSLIVAIIIILGIEFFYQISSELILSSGD